nr:putative odorant receptor 92a [Helicoverpa armigera]
MCHQLYRCFAVTVVVLYNAAHVIFIIQSRNSLSDMLDCTMLEIPHMNLLVKVFTLNWHIQKIDKINRLLKDPIFAPITKKDEEMLQSTTKLMHLWVKLSKICITMITPIWFTSFLVKRYQDPTAIVSAYTPYETDTWEGFTYSVLQEVLPILWTGYGHLALDCLVVTYYAQAEVQLKMIKYNLEHLFDVTEGTEYCRDYGLSGLYRDVLDDGLRNRFIHYVRRYEAVAWYVKEVGNVFNTAVSFQFFSSSATLCIITYEMSSTPVVSVPFAFLAMVLIIILMQVFIYCYFGNMVQCESDSVITSIYLSDWLSASPQLRRLVLIAMIRWSRSLTPRVSGIIPMSLATYVSILRSAYSLFAVLSTK